MNKKMRKQRGMGKGIHGLRFKLLLAVAIAGACALISYTLMELASDWFVYEVMESTGFETRVGDQCLDRLDSWVTRNQVAATDEEQIDKWVNSLRMMYIDMNIYRGDDLVYGSAYEVTGYDDAGNIITESYNYLAEMEGTSVREIAFADGNATVYLYGYFYVYIYFMYGQIALAIAIFIIVFLLLIRRKIHYIRQLEQEIKVLETGGLDQPITVKGRDELASLADDLDRMRQTLLENMTERDRITDANNQLVVAVAHDVRTPLTSLMLYLDMLHKEPDLPEATKQEYLEKARTKTAQIKGMTDQLFDRFLKGQTENLGTRENEKADAVKAEVAWNDRLSMFVEELADHGLECECDIHWPEGSLQVEDEAISRILDNVASNLYKYAAQTAPVQLKVRTLEEGERLRARIASNSPFMVLEVGNGIRQTEQTVESTGQGLKNVQTMMEMMHGLVRTEQTEEWYTIRLYFEMV